MRYILILLVLAACGGDQVRYAVPLPQSQGRAAVGVGSIEVRDAGLPLYAGLEEIYVQQADGGLVSDTSTLWADDPQRGVTQGLASALARLTTARVAAEPWPLTELPDARLEVRFDTFVARADAQFVISGQYFVARAEGSDRAGRFAIQVPYDPESIPSLAAAQGRAIDLAGAPDRARGAGRGGGLRRNRTRAPIT